MQLIEPLEDKAQPYSPQRLQSITNLLKRQQTRILVQYSHINIHTLQFTQILNNSAIELSKMIFEKQLKLIEPKFAQLHQQKCCLQEFVLIMLEVLDIQLNKAAASIIGLKQMFQVLASNNGRFITFQHLFKYVIGLSAISSTYRETISNTQFRMQYVESRQQDFLLHDLGIQQILYMQSLKVILCLDKECHYLRIYNKDLKLIGKFCPNGDSHGNKQPKIKGFVVNDFQSEVGLSIKDQSVVIFNLKNFIQQTSQQFLLDQLNQDVVYVDYPITRLFYFVTWGKYIIQCQEKRNQLYKIDFEKKHSSRVQKITGMPDIDIISMMYLTTMNQVVIAAGAQVYFYNQNMTQHLHTFQHSSQIHTLRNYEKKFFVGGLEDSITMFQYDKVSKDFKVKVIQTNTKIDIQAFQIFYQLGIIVLIDQKYQVHTMQLNKYTLYQTQSYKHISRFKHAVKTFKLSKDEMFMFGSYIVKFEIQKNPLKKQIEIKMSDCYGINYQNQSMFLFVDNMFMELSILRGNLIEVYTYENSNLAPVCGFFTVKQNNFRPILVTQNSDIYDLYSNDDNSSINRYYKRKIPLDLIFGSSYCSKTKIITVWSQDKVFQIQCQGNNSYHVVNNVYLKQDKIKDVFVQLNDLILYLESGLIVTIDRFTIQTNKIENYILSNETIVDILIFYRVGDLDIMLCNNNILLLSANKGSVVLQIQLQSLVNTKIDINFSRMKYSQIVNQQHHIQQRGIFLMDDVGFVIYISLDLKLQSKLKISFNQPKRRAYQFLKGAQPVEFKKINNIYIKNFQTYSPKGVKVIKSHDIIVTQCILVYFEELGIITYAYDGLIKLWSFNDTDNLFFSIRLPNFIHNTWDMHQIHQKRSNRNIAKTINLLTYLKQTLDKGIEKTNNLLIKSRIMKKQKQLKKKKQLKNIIQFTIEPEYQQYITVNQYDSMQNTLRAMKLGKGIKRTRHTSQPKPHWKKAQFANLINTTDQKRRGEQLPKQLESLRTTLDPRVTKRSRSRRISQAQKIFYHDFSIQTEAKSKDISEIEETLGKINAKPTFDGIHHIRMKRGGPRFNIFDEIDREFQAKRQQHKRNMTRKIINQKIQRQRQSSLQFIQPTRESPSLHFVDTINKIFSEHNRQVSSKRRGHYVSLPKVTIERN